MRQQQMRKKIIAIGAAPVFSSAVTNPPDADKIVITMLLALSDATPATAAFSTSGITGAPSVDTVVVSGTSVTLILSGDIITGDTVLVSYTRPGPNALQSTNHDKAISFVNQSVTNNI